MKKQLSIVVMGALVGATSLVWIVSKDQRMASPIATASVPRAAARAQSSPLAQATAPVQPTAQPLPTVRQAPVVIPPDGSTEHTAQPGETVASMAGDLLGSDSKTNRDAIINANASLKADPDKLLAGKSYTIPSTPPAPAAVAPTAPAVTPAPATAAPQTVLKYTAKAGDTVTQMAGAFLGSDDQANQDAITRANPSLRADPDHVVAGRSYKIPAPDGLSAAAAPSPAASTARPAIQPDADTIVAAAAPRTLRYTAKAGDTLGTMAIALLGSDTKQTRDAIISNNPALKENPDRVVAGQMYWIPAPAASVSSAIESPQ